MTYPIGVFWFHGKLNPRALIELVSLKLEKVNKKWKILPNSVYTVQLFSVKFIV